MRNFLIALTLLLTIAVPAKADELTIDLSEEMVAITTAFDGASLLLFGATEGQQGDVIIVVRGPDGDEIVRRKEHKIAIWVNGAEMTFEGIPSYYAVLSSKPLNDLLPDSVLEAEQIGAQHLSYTVSNVKGDDLDESEFFTALIRNKVSTGLYVDHEEDGVRFMGDHLFRTDLTVPSTVDVGDYTLKTYLVRDGAIINTYDTDMQIKKIGVEAMVYNFAHEHAFFYGILAVIIAAMAGWTANVIFRKA